MCMNGNVYHVHIFLEAFRNGPQRDDPSESFKKLHQRWRASAGPGRAQMNMRVQKIPAEPLMSSAQHKGRGTRAGRGRSPRRQCVAEQARDASLRRARALTSRGWPRSRARRGLLAPIVARGGGGRGRRGGERRGRAAARRCKRGAAQRAGRRGRGAGERGGARGGAGAGAARARRVARVAWVVCPEEAPCRGSFAVWVVSLSPPDFLRAYLVGLGVLVSGLHKVIHHILSFYRRICSSGPVRRDGG
jgi:hypothetical protein